MKFAWRDPLIGRVARILGAPTHGQDYSRDLNHDVYHHLAVEKLAVMIVENEPVNADEEIVRAAALIHDIGYALDHFSSHVEAGVRYAPELLCSVSFPADKVSQVAEVIRLHDDRRGMDRYKPTDVPEILVVQDADVLESMGARGIVRMAYFCAQKGIPIVDHLGLIVSNVDAGRVSNRNFIDNYNQWQVPLPGQLNYSYARKLALKRVQLERHFRRRLEREISEVFGEVMK